MTSEGQERVVTSTTGTVVIWAVPRSVSTAFEKALSRSQGVVAVHEPFTDCYYFGPTRRSSRYGDAEAFSGFHGAAAESRIHSARANWVVVKELCFQAGPYVSDELLDRVSNTFMIRHPAVVLRSLMPLKPDFTEEEFGYTAFHKLWERVQRITGQIPHIVEGDSFRRAPDDTLKKYCEHTGLPFERSMLQWRPGVLKPWDSHEAESQSKWHMTLESSSGILPPGDPVTIEPPSERRLMYLRACEIYEEIVQSSRADSK